MPHDDRPEHIHMVVCGVGFFSLYALLRSLHLNHLTASFAVIVAAFPLMYLLLPISSLFYFAISKPETRRTSVHVTDAGCGALVFLVFALLLFSVLEGTKHSRQRGQNTATQQRR
jgi:uncharacterized membrane protein YhfC